MILLKMTGTIFLSLALQINLSAQSKEEVAAMQNIMDVPIHKDDFHYAKKINNEADALVSGLFLFYKYFISSQDRASCVFYPSCSVYALQSVQKHGLFMGGLAAFDRLTRCNGLSPNNYEINPETHLFYDPVQ